MADTGSNSGGAAEQVTALTAALRRALETLWGAVQAAEAALLADWPSLSPSGRRARLRGLQRLVTREMAAAQTLARDTLPDVVHAVYELGGTAAALDVGVRPTFGATDTAAVRAAIADTYAAVLDATRYVSETTKALIRALGKDHVLDKLRTGSTPAQAARALAADLADQGIAAIVYADGSRHGLADYTDMLIRTKTAEAYQVAGLTQTATQGIGYVELLDGPGCGLDGHETTPKANGLILPVDVAQRHLLSHPRCRRVSTPRPDITSSTDAASAAPVGPQHTAEDIAAAARTSGRSLDSRSLTEAGVSAAQRRHAARVARRTA